MISMAPPEGTPSEENSQAYYVIKSAQEKEELQREGDQLNEQIKKAEKEIIALKNTLQIINSNNSNIKNQNSRVGDQSNFD
jgi:UDP-glucose:O-linked fucose beta-1,3-glucosyltransferase